jgi:hypothetical protein
MQIKEMANFIMYVLVEFVFSDSYMHFDLNLNAIIIKLHDEAIYIYQETPGDGAKRMLCNP